MLLPTNTNVGEGQANGMQMTLEKVVLKPNVVPKIVMIGDNNNIPVKASCQGKSSIAHRSKTQQQPHSSSSVLHKAKEILLQSKSSEAKSTTSKGKRA